MDAAELGRRRAADLHEQAVTTGKDPRLAYAFVLAEAKRRGLDVEKANPGASMLDGGRATYVPADGLIIHENIGSDFEQAFLVAHELGVVTKKVVHALPGCKAFDAGVGSGEVVSVGPGSDGLCSLCG